MDSSKANEKQIGLEKREHTMYLLMIVTSV